MSKVERLLQILSHNVGQDLASSEALDMLLWQNNADIVLLQELPQAYIDGHIPTFAHVYPYQSYSPLQSIKRIGMAILSRYPIVDTDYFKLAKCGLVYQQRVIIDVHGKSAIIYNIHLTYPRIDVTYAAQVLHYPLLVYNDSIRHEEIGQLVALIQNESHPVIAGGDFNMTTRSSDYRHLTTVLKDAYRLVGRGIARSWPARRMPTILYLPPIPFVRIDYLFHSSSIQPSTAHFLKKTGSDHLPLLTSVLLTG